MRAPHFLLHGAVGATAALGLALASPPRAADTVAVRAGTIHLVEEGRVAHDATLLVRDGKIVAVGADVRVPVGTQIIDYGPDAVIVPGLVAAFSLYGSGPSSSRTAEPGVRGVDSFDFYGRFGAALSGGVTSVYVTPSDVRLIAGQGGLVKLAGDDFEKRTLTSTAALHLAIDAGARNAPGFWKPPIPATVDVGIGVLEPQLPRTTMGAIVALQEILSDARAEKRDSFYGPYLAQELDRMLAAGTPWRVGARTEPEIRAALAFAREADLPLVIDKADAAKDLAGELAAAGASVVWRLPFEPNRDLSDHGKDEDAAWPSYDAPTALAAAGVRFAIASTSPRDLLFAAAQASADGLDAGTALRAITLAPAEILGAGARVGSLAPGKDADFAVLNGAPLSGRTSVLATWIDGALAWKATETKAVVLHVDELYLGNGEVLRPGELLMLNGRIADVGERVSRPRGAHVVSGPAAMPGIVDALGHLGLEGTRKVPSADFELSTILSPGDRTDRRVAAAGVTTVVLSPRGEGRDGAPLAAYKPAAEAFDDLMVDELCALRMRWTERNRLQSGQAVKAVLGKAAEYAKEWEQYRAELAQWKPSPEKDDEASDEDAKKGDDEKEAGSDEADDDEDKKKKKKKKGDYELPPDPVTGVWEAEITRAPHAGPQALKLRMLFEAAQGSGEVWGNLRCNAVSETLVELEGYWNREENALELSGLGSSGWVKLSGALGEKGFAGKLAVGGATVEVEAKRTATEFQVVRRPNRKPEPREKEPKGKPKEPKFDAKLEPVVAAMRGRKTIVVEVHRRDEILDCVNAFAHFGIRPVLFEAEDAYKVAEELRGRVAGVLLSHRTVVYEAERGSDYRTPWADVQNAGIPVAFYSGVEEGAAQLFTFAAYAVANGMSPAGALRALTVDAARMMSIGERVGALETGLDADVLLLDGPPLEPGTRVLRTWVNGREVPGL